MVFHNYTTNLINWSMFSEANIEGKGSSILS